MTEDGMVGWHHWLRHEFEQVLGVGDGQGSLACCSPWGHKESDTAEWLNWTEAFILFGFPSGSDREGNGTHSSTLCLENHMDGGAWKAAVHGVAQSRTWLRWLSSSSSSSGSDGKESACNEGDLDSIPGLEISPGKGNGYPLQYSYLKNPHGQKSLVGYSPWSHKESDMTEQLSTYTSFYFNPSIFINPSEIGDFHFPYDESSFDSHIS